MALDHDAVLPSLDEFVVEEDLELFMEEFPAAVGKECLIWTLTTYVFSHEILKFIGQLDTYRVSSVYRTKFG